MSKGKLEIDFETADRITVTCLKDQKKLLKKELTNYKKGQWLHPEDVVRNQQVIEALDLIIKHYGG